MALNSDPTCSGTFPRTWQQCPTLRKMRASFLRGTSRCTGRFETSDWGHKLFRKLLIEGIHQVKREVTFTRHGQTSSSHHLPLPGHKTGTINLRYCCFSLDFDWIYKVSAFHFWPSLLICARSCVLWCTCVNSNVSLILITREMMCEGSVWWTEEDRRKVTLVCQGIRCLSTRTWRSF